MMRGFQIFLFLLAVLGQAPTSWGASACRFASEPTVIEKAPALLLQSWEWEGDDLNLSSLPESEVFANYRKAVSDTVSTDSRFLLRRYYRQGPRMDDAYNLVIAATADARQTRPISCVEALLLDFQIRRTPRMLTHPTEFLAFFLQRAGRHKIYYMTSDSEGVRGLGKIESLISADVREGWDLVGNLHNHSFFLDDLDKTQPQGVLAPSASDIGAFRAFHDRQRLKSASITNGFETIHIPAPEFDLYRAAP